MVNDARVNFQDLAFGEEMPFHAYFTTFLRSWQKDLEENKKYY